MTTNHRLSRRQFLAAALAGAGVAGATAFNRRAADTEQALIAITYDLEMSRNFPKWEDTHWDYEKGNLDEPTKKYTVEACRRVKAAGGVLHCFAVGQVFEQESVDWLSGIAKAGHPIGSHTYDHVNVTARRPQDIQFRFNRAPWLIEGRVPADVIRDNIRLTTAAMKTRLGLAPAGFRTPGGFSNGVRDRPDLQKMLLDQGFTWASCLYPPHKNSKPGEVPGPDVYESIVQAQQMAQPFVYPSGLVEVPMSPISDIGAFRNGRWKLEYFLKAIRLGVEWAIAKRAVFDLLCHPSCIGVMDPEFRTVDLVCELVQKAANRAAIVGLGTIAERARQRKRS